MKTAKMLLPAIAAIILAAFATLQSGCLAVAAAGAAGGTVAYLRGDLRATVDATLPQTKEAVVAALEKDLGLIISTRDIKGNSAKYISRNNYDKELTIYVERVDEDDTLISIRVGVFGNEARSREVLDAIRARL